VLARRIALLVALTLVVSACGGGVGGTPPPTGTGRISGTVGVAVTGTSPGAPAVGVHGIRPVRRPSALAPRFVPDQVLVRYRPGATSTQAADLHRRHGTREMRRLDRLDMSVVRIPSGETVDGAIQRLRADPAVQHAEPNYYRYRMNIPSGPRPLATPNDPFYAHQWHYRAVDLPLAWDITTGSALVVVAVIDTGILSAHEDLAGITVQGYDFYEDDSNPEDPGCEDAWDLSHGSHVAGTIAAATNNGRGVAGVNWGGPGKTRIMPLRIFGNYGGTCTATVADIAAAIVYAADRNARVINMSFGADSYSQFEQNAVTYAYNAGVTLVAAAGNDNEERVIYPAGYANVIGVSATDAANNKAYYSSFGSHVDLAAPGGDVRVGVDLNGDGRPDGVLSTSGAPARGINQYWYFEGTSMAAPHVAGLAALLISKGVTGPAAVQQIMQSTARDLGTPGYDSVYGWGLINAAAALGAPVATNPMRAFSGTLAGSAISLTSDIVPVASDGAYLVTNAQTGVRSVFAWQDANGNGLIDAGDLLGVVHGVVVSAGTTTPGVHIAVTRVLTGTPPITVTGSGR